MKYIKSFKNFESVENDDEKEFLDYISELSGLKVTNNSYNSGSFGDIYETSDLNKLVKITTDEWEYLTAKKLIGEHKYLYNIYKTSEIDSRYYGTEESYYYDEESDDYLQEDGDRKPLYLIVMERIDLINDNRLKKIISKLCIYINYNVNAINDLDKYVVNSDDTEIIKISNELKDILNELYMNDIEQSDFNIGNIGIKNNHLCLFDISGRF
jgi:hypothetical protein